MKSQTHWHAEDITKVLSVLASTTNGLSQEEAEFRLKLDGPNELELVKRTTPIMRFLRQFHNILIYVLLISAVVTIFLEYWVDSAVILGVVVLNAIFGFIQEGKAEDAIDAIREMLAPTANVIRDGMHLAIPAKDLVNGDIILIKSGDKVPADLRLIEAKNLQIQESILTGESNAVEKDPKPVSQEASIGDRLSMAYSGTSVIYGRGMGVVVAIARDSELGKISSMLKAIEPLATPLIRQMDIFGRWLTLVITLLAVITFLIGVFVWHNSPTQMFMAGVGLAVAAIPEGLPPILTIILAIGVTRMAKRKAIIRRLPAVETMGSVTTICTDKTGTLTRNEQTVRNIITATQQYGVDENGGVAFSLDKSVVSVSDHKDLMLALEAVILCNDGSFFFNDQDKRWHIQGNPVDKALLELGAKAKFELKLIQQDHHRLDLIPYESEHKFMATLHRRHSDDGFIYIKGAPEQLLLRCATARVDGANVAIDRQYWQEQIEILAHQGYRVIAVACKQVDTDKLTLFFDDVASELTLIALFGLIDAPRLEAAQAVEECGHARIKVKMITGDHAVTAATIAMQVGIDSKGGVLTGSDLDKMSDEELSQVVCNVNVYARTSPQHKLRLVEALQANGEIVAMTGDGVNDAPALRKANIGVAMGQKGAELAKDSADMVLGDDNFATIVHAIEEGRVVYDNLRKVILHILPTNAAEGFVLIIAIVLGIALPITAVQILWVNMITAVTLATALGFEPKEELVMQRPPSNAHSSIISKLLVWRIVIVTCFLVIGVFIIFNLELNYGVGLDAARTGAVNMLVFGEAIYLLNCRKLHSSIFNYHNFIDNPKVFIAIVTTIGLQMLFTYLPVMQKFFGTAAIGWMQWMWIIAISLLVFALVEVEKFVVKKSAILTLT